MFLDTRLNQTNKLRTSTSTSSNSGIHLNNEFASDSLSSLAAGSSLSSPAATAPASASPNVTDIDSVVTKATPFRRFKSKLVKKKEKTGSVSSVQVHKGKGKPYEEVVPGSAGCPNDVAEMSSSSSSKISPEKLIVVDEEVVSEDSNKPYRSLETVIDVKQQNDSTSDSDIGAADSRTESASKLAHRIQTLLSSSCNPSHFFPFSTTATTATSADESPSTTTVQEEITPSSQHQQQPSPPPSNNDSRFKLVPDSFLKLHLTDTKFMNFLTTSPHSVMSGGTKPSSDSLHDVLDKWTRFVIRKHQGQQPKTTETEPESHENSDMVGADDSDSDSSSIVLSCPLEPTSETKVEIARSKVLSVDLDAEPSIESSTPQSFLSNDRNGFWSSFRNTSPRQTADLNAPSPSNSNRLKEIRVWYPSRTNVSLEATWWGYRIYLPPPVMQILSDKSLEAAKRAAMITAALTWLISRIPLEILPPQFKPLTLILKEIVPLVGYVGGFIAWSWNSVKGFDKGDGVILSATWVLPIALIPGTWIYTEPNSDIPLENLFASPNTTTGSNSSPPPPPPKDTSSTTASRSVFTSIAESTQGGFRQLGSSFRHV